MSTPYEIDTPCTFQKNPNRLIGYIIHDCGGFVLAETYREDTTHRIVDCINACHGISAAELEYRVKVGAGETAPYREQVNDDAARLQFFYNKMERCNGGWVSDAIFIKDDGFDDLGDSIDAAMNVGAGETAEAQS